MILPSPTLVLSAILAFSVATGGAYLKGRSDGKALELGNQLEKTEMVRAAREAAQAGAAEAIAQIKIKNITIRQEVQREILKDIVYRDCVHTPDGLRLINAALAGESVPVGDSQLSREAASSD